MLVLRTGFEYYTHILRRRGAALGALAATEVDETFPCRLFAVGVDAHIATSSGNTMRSNMFAHHVTKTQF